MKDRCCFFFLFLLCLFVCAPSMAEAAWQPTIAVGLLEGQTAVTFSAAGSDGKLTTSVGGSRISSVPQNTMTTVSAGPGGLEINGRAVPADHLLLEASDTRKADAFRTDLQGRTYRGTMEFLLLHGQITVVNHVRVEDYVKGVIAKEMPPEWPAEAVKAQAIAARTFALKNRGRHKARGYDLCTNTHCQVYEGVSAERPLANQAVDATYGEVLEYQGRLIDALFHTDSGGMTENSEDVWGTKIPYLRAEREKAWGTQPWTKNIPANALLSHFSRKGDIGELKSVTLSRLTAPSAKGYAADRTASGRVRTLRLTGTQGTMTIRGNELRDAFGLRSTLFDVTLKNGSLIFSGYGWGHGLGLSQWGARAFAASGESYAQILAHYYRGTERKQLYKKQVK
ncbi:MAG: SpoIID/LytB domain-containing protein [Selenomonadaceae bacterium]|nr:SpoIID/LytB domain-containing protein [Selenomonadaceae bacterium]